MSARRQLSTKPVSKEDVDVALNREIVPYIRQVAQDAASAGEVAEAAAIAAGEASDSAAAAQLAAENAQASADAAADSAQDAIDAAALADAAADAAQDAADLAASAAYEAGRVDLRTYYSPEAAWDFSAPTGNVVDKTGNGHTFVEETSPVPLPAPGASAGLIARRCTGSTKFSCADTALNILGAWSGEILCNGTTFAQGGYLMAWTGSSELQNANATWTLAPIGTGGNTIGGRVWENSTGVDVTIPVVAALNTGVWIHILQTRNLSGRFRTYLNGQMVDERTLAMPTGGGNASFLYLGGSVEGVASTFLTQYAAIYTVELTAAQALDLAEKRLGKRSVV
jgi:hypothetical protein